MTYVVYFLARHAPSTRVLTSVFVLTFCAAVGAQKGLTGTWQGQTPNGASITLALAAKGTTLTGTLTRNDEKAPLTDGKVSKNTFNFKAEIRGQVEAFSGELTGDEIKVWLDRQGPAEAIVLRRVKDK